MPAARTSVVGSVRILSTQLSSIVQAGDSVAVSPRSEALAVQRQVADYYADEGNFGSFRIFRQNIPEPLLDESWSFSVRNDNPFIQVGYIHILGISASSVLQIGSNKLVDTESRTKHIRQLLEGKRPV
jgi:spore germination protein PE